MVLERVRLEPWPYHLWNVIFWGSVLFSAEWGHVRLTGKGKELLD